MSPIVSFILWLWAAQAAVAPPAAAIHGTVVRAGSNEPLAKARVELLRGDRVPYRTAVTDFRGTFSFEQIEAGRYVIAASRDGFSRQEYGQRGRNEAGTVLVIGAERRIEDIRVPLLPAPTILGTIYGPNGEHLAGATVEAYRLQYTITGPEMILIKTALSNDLGEYRMFWLEPGSYYVKANYGPRGFRPQSPNVSKPDDGYVSVYYPDALTSGGARQVRVTTGLEYGGINISFDDSARSSIIGRAYDPSNRPSPGVPEVVLYEAHADSVAGPGYPISVRPSGDFEIRGVSPGSYVLMAFLQGMPDLFSDPVRVDVSRRTAEVVGPILLSMSPGLSVSGRILLDGGAPPHGLNFDGAQVRFVPRRGSTLQQVWSGGVNRFGDFRDIMVPRGDYDVELKPVPPGYFVKRITIGARDVRRSGLQGFRDIPRMEVILSSAGARISGDVVNRGGEPVTYAQIVIVPEVAFRTRGDSYRVAGLDSSGRFQIEDMPPGNYRIFAFEELERGAYYHPDFIRRYGDKSVALKLEEGGSATVDLTIIPASETLGEM